jgi:hypothetical protein
MPPAPASGSRADASAWFRDELDTTGLPFVNRRDGGLVFPIERRLTGF